MILEQIFCPICNFELAFPLPESCPGCGKKHLNHDITLVPSMHGVPDVIEKLYLKWLKKARKFFKAKNQYDSLLDEIMSIREEVRELKEEKLIELVNLYCNMTGLEKKLNIKPITKPEIKVERKEPTITEKPVEIIIEPEVEEVFPTFKDHKTVIVGKTSKADFKSIAEAIKNSEPGTHILVKPGKYKEDVVIDRHVEIIGDGKLDEIILTNRIKNCIMMNTEYARVSGIILNSKASAKGKTFFAVDIPSGKLLLENCSVSSDAAACIAIHGGNSNPTIRRCRIHKGKQNGIYIFDNAKGRIDNCDIYDNEKIGIVVSQNSAPTIIRTVIHDCLQSGILVFKNAKGSIENCKIYSNKNSGIEIREGGNPSIRQTISCANKEYGVYVSSNGQGMIENSDIYDNNIAGVFIRDKGNTFIKQSNIYRDKKYGILISENGQGVIESCDISDHGLAAIEINDSSNPTIRRCKIHESKGYGIYVNKYGKGKIDNCDIFNNNSSGVSISSHGTPLIKKCRIYDNKQS